MGRRILGLFVVGALLPVVILAGLTYTAVTGQLESQAEARLIQLSDDIAQSVMERLGFFTAWLGGVGTLAVADSNLGGDGEALFESLSELLPPGVEGLALETEGRVRTMAGLVGDLPGLDAADREHLSTGAAVLKDESGAVGASWVVYLAMGVRAADPGRGVLWVRITADSLWASGIVRAREVEDFCVLDADARPFYCSQGEGSSLPRRVKPVGSVPGSVKGLLDRSEGGPDDIAAWHDVFLRASFNADPWMIAVSESTESVYGPVESFVYNVLVAMVTALGVVLLLSNMLVRRTMGPLEKLTEGTRRIAGQDLSTRVDIQSKDEFGELARSFNTMGERLEDQFRQISAGRAIDQAVISAGDQGTVMEALLDGLDAVISSGRAAVLLVDPGSDAEPSLYSQVSGGDVVIQGAPLTEAGRTWLYGDEFAVPVADAVDVSRLFGDTGFGEHGASTLVLRLEMHGEPLGAVAISSRDGSPFSETDVRRAQQLVNRAAVGLNELKLRRDLEDMSWEALRALANAIDAKSKWTSGHSERVTELALELGRHLQLDEKELETLKRGGLLHDLGKIGVPVDILDFAGPLDAKMRQTINEHPVIGARILEPIRAFKPILPIVLYHHERWDGLGYPEGLRGPETHPLARLLAVADSFDAMVSARPYRAAIAPQVVLDHILAESGTAFDPEIVGALVAVMEGGWVHQKAEMEVSIDG